MRYIIERAKCKNNVILQFPLTMIYTNKKSGPRLGRNGSDCQRGRAHNHAYEVHKYINKSKIVHVGWDPGTLYKYSIK
jgi:hypothetical protein